MKHDHHTEGPTDRRRADVLQPERELTRTEKLALGLDRNASQAEVAEARRKIREGETD